MGPSKIIKNLEWLIETEMDNIEYLVEANRQGPLGYAQTRLATYQAALAFIQKYRAGGAGYLSRRDYLMEPVPEGVQGVITNPPYKLAMEFVEKAVREAERFARGEATKAKLEAARMDALSASDAAASAASMAPQEPPVSRMTGLGQ
jgi:hypothetical protein